VFLISCSDGKKKTEIEIDGLKIEGWEITVKKGKTDTLNLKAWFPESEISIQFKNKLDSTCLTPNIEFYPVELESYMEKRLMDHLVVRSTLFPPPPMTFNTKKHFGIAWNFESHMDFKCCDCFSLKEEILQKLNLKVKEEPFKKDFNKYK